MDEQKKTALAAVDTISDRVCALSDAIWDTPELGFQEHHAMRLQCELLEQLGFRVETNVGGIPTAFSGTWAAEHP